MKIMIKTILLFCALFTGTLAIAADQTKTIKSPDRKLTARISSIHKAKEGPPEFIIEVIDASGKLTARKDFTSEEGDQGLSIDRAEWSPDSQFFVFSTFSSGGHMAWQFPTYFYARRDKKIHDFADFLAPIAEGDFVLKPPDNISITIWTPMTPEKPLDKSIELLISFRMRDLTQPKK
jgi:hypothetical protein